MDPALELTASKGIQRTVPPETLMSEDLVRIETPHGILEVKPMAARTREALGFLLAMTGEIEHEGQRMLALVADNGQRVLSGLRIGYGWYGPKNNQQAMQFAAACRATIPSALQRFRARSFRGTLFPTAYWFGNEGEHLQAGELIFIHVEAPREPSKSGESFEGFDRLLGVGSSDLLIEFAKDLGDAWKAADMPSRTITDLEPCKATNPAAHWMGDLVLVDDRIALLRPQLVPTDPYLAIVRGAGIERIEHTPSIMVMRGQAREGSREPHRTT